MGVADSEENCQRIKWDLMCGAMADGVQDVTLCLEGRMQGESS